MALPYYFSQTKQEKPHWLLNHRSDRMKLDSPSPGKKALTGPPRDGALGSGGDTARTKLSPLLSLFRSVTMAGSGSQGWI